MIIIMKQIAVITSHHHGDPVGSDPAEQVQDQILYMSQGPFQVISQSKQNDHVIHQVADSKVHEHGR